MFHVSHGALLRGQGGSGKRGDESRGCESQLWRAAVHSSVSLAPLLSFSVCIPPDTRKAVAAVHRIGLSRKSHPFTRSACPWYLLIYSSNRTETVLAKLNLVLHFAAELLMLRCNHYFQISSAEWLSWVLKMMLLKPVPFTKCSVPARGHMTGGKDG